MLIPSMNLKGIQSSRLAFLGLAILIGWNARVSAITFTFDADPFAGSDALTTPGRQVVGAESFVDFSIASDSFSFDPTVFGIQGSIHFANDTIGNLPSTGLNVVVFQSFDTDNDPNTPFGAGNAASLIAAQLTSPGSGFFIYFNSNLDLPRLAFSTDLSDPTSDLKILARMTNLEGDAGRSAIPTFTSANFQLTTDPSISVPEHASNLTLLIAAAAVLAARYTLRPKSVRLI
jgi:hypothetical protein